MILVTGGTGLVGAHLLAYLAKNEQHIKAIYRTPDKLEAVKKVFSYYFDDAIPFFDKIEWFKADVTDVPSLELVFPNVTHVYHVAAFISFDPKDFDVLRKINIEGTANIVNLCIGYGVKKLCFVSSIAAVGENEDPTIPITEETHWNPEADNNVYAISKYGSEMEVWRGSQEGLEVVIVNPAIILGAGFWRSGSGSLFRAIKKGLKYYTKGILSYVDIKDVVSVMIQLMNSDIKSERFILVGENWTLEKFTKVTAKALQVKPPEKEAGSFLLGFAWRMDWWRQFFTGKRRKLTKQTAQSIQSQAFFDSSKIQNTLNFTFTPVEESIERVSKRYDG
ncbi:NAD-dependent epimerase/dehydratase family protein [Kordia sp. YSTF-M3]|uniref:NAD-dependent epimerase/dehydratase family protein n=1 Tax=Kordia aestuariivivens TaxID=2759037 RepID=A0ABR7QAF8_9FLAO|nr:NAD-dependent epimerase/dehydratase family protein [Kordia aestuariivivens]MBC8755523.1 NAD-dependent epimerase/dehydratase family protein [Kordia aestuariivivens]